jgi:hypothetical protein
MSSLIGYIVPSRRVRLRDGTVKRAPLTYDLPVGCRRHRCCYYMCTVAYHFNDRENIFSARSRATVKSAASASGMYRAAMRVPLEILRGAAFDLIV